MNKLFVTIGTAVVAVALAATATAYEWNPSAHQTDFDGIATVGYAEPATTVTNVTVVAPAGAAGSTVAFTGGNTFEFAEDATVMLDKANLRFTTPVAGGGISIVNGAETFCSTNTFDEWLYPSKERSPSTGRDVLVFPNLTVDEIEFDSAWLWSGAVPSTVVHDNGFVERTATTLSAQFQMLHQDLSKGVRVTLLDGEGGIYAHVDYGRVVNKLPYALSMDDLAVVKANGGYDDLPVVRDGSSTTGYGVRAVTVRRRIPEGCDVMSVSNAQYSVAAAAIGSGATLELDSLAEGSALTNFSLVHGATLRIRDMPDVAVVGGFHASGGRLSFEQPLAENEMCTVSTNVAAPAMGNTAEKFLIGSVSMDNLVSWSVPKLDGSMSSTGVSDPIICFVKTNETTKTIQFQVQVTDNSFCKGSVIEFIERGGNLFVRKLISAYWPASSAAAGTVDILDPSIDLSGSWTDNGYYRPKSFDLVYRQSMYLVEKAMTTMVDTTARLVLANTKVSDIRSIYVDHLYFSISTNKIPIYCFENRTEDMIEFQLQVADDWTKTGKFRFYQNGLDVWGVKVMSCWTKQEVAGAKSIDDPDYNYTGGKRQNDNLYYINQIYDLPSMTLGVRELPHMNVTVPAMKRYAATNLTVDVGANVTLTVGSGSALPQNGTVNVAGTLNVTNSNAIGTGTINVSSGGQLYLVRDNAVANNTQQTFYIDGGELVAGDDLSYMNTPVFMNGAKATKRKSSGEFRVGVKNFKWIAGGTSCSTCSVPIRCVSGNKGTAEYTMTWQVADATGDADVDFWMNANMTDFDDGGAGGIVTPNGGMIHKKTGAGTLRWGGVSTCTGIVQVVEGTLLLGVNNAINPGNISTRTQCQAAQPVQINGGTLAAEAFTTNSAQRLSVSTATSAIALGEGASLSFGEFDGFAEGARLGVTLGEGSTLRFGTELSDAQLRKIRINGNHRAQQNENGDIVDDGVPGVLIFIR